ELPCLHCFIKNNACQIWKRGLTHVFWPMRYLVKARVKSGCEPALLKSIWDGTLGKGSVAGDEYLHDMRQARISAKGEACWVETCVCHTPLEGERRYWEKHFQLLGISDAPSRRSRGPEDAREV